MRGDALVYGTFYSHRNFTGWRSPVWSSATPTWKAAGKQTEESFEVWERFRLRSDFVANEAVKFRLEIKVEDTWGHGTFTAANPSAALMVYGAYLQFKWPGCNVETTAGLQPLALPQSKLFYSSPVFGDRMRLAAPLLVLLAIVALPGRASALETQTITAQRISLGTESEAPYVEADGQTLALPSAATAVFVTDRDFDALRQFLKRHCIHYGGCELTYETETKTVIAIRTATDQYFAVPYTEKTKRTITGTPKTFRTVLHDWSRDAAMLTVRTQAGNYCIPNDYVWKEYRDKAQRVLSGIGAPDTGLAALITVTVYPQDGDGNDDCAAFLGDIKRGR